MSTRRRLVATFVLTAWLTAACGGAATDEAGPAASGEQQTVVLISFDGFRWDYIELAETPNLDRLIERGVRAESLIPVYPSKTFPSHYSIVTGLHPGHHGIISNNMRDPRWPEPFGLGNRAEVQNDRWWGGEPIWVTAGRNGLGTAVYFWPGSEAPVQGIQPDIWFPYDGDVPWDDRVDAALEWLGGPEDERPSFVALYFEEPNTSGHELGPTAPETLRAVTEVDALLGRFLDGLDALGQLESTDIVVVSDHGMAQNDPERVIFLDDYVDLEADELFEFGALLQIYPREGREDEIFAALDGAHPNLRVFRPADAPPEFHLYEHPRLAPIMGAPDVGWEVMPKLWYEARGVISGNHGQNPEHPDMHGLFVAVGPSFSQGARVDSLHSVDIYNLLAAALGIPPAPNDGDLTHTTGILREGTNEP